MEKHNPPLTKSNFDGISLYVLPLAKDEVFSFILSTWGRGAFRGFTKHVLPAEYDEWLAQRDKRLADCVDNLPASPPKDIVLLADCVDNLPASPPKDILPD